MTDEEMVARARRVLEKIVTDDAFEFAKTLREAGYDREQVIEIVGYWIKAPMTVRSHQSLFMQIYNAIKLSVSAPASAAMN